MNETPLPTPRTDEAAAQYRFHEANPFNLAVVSIDVSKQLERELSAAQDELAIVTDQLEVETHRHREGAESWLEMRRRIEAERDAATAACAAKHAALLAVERWMNGPPPTRWDESVRPLMNKALSNPAGQELLKELREAKQQAYDWHQQSESSWKNRDEFCKHINIIGHEVLGFQSDNCAPDAVSREAKKLLATQSARIAELEEFKWSAELPNEQCLWWWWDGDEDSAPCPVSIMYSGTNNNYFAAMDQHGWNESQDLEDMGGLWCKVREPEVPTREQQEAARKALAAKGGETV